MAARRKRSRPTRLRAETPEIHPAAVIDVGTTSIRMAIADIGEDGRVHVLESLSQAVPLGKDTFTSGSIGKATLEKCVQALRSYQRKLGEYQVQDQALRVVATSAVREASNRLAFLDRIYSATGIEVQPIDEAEINRITYLGIEPLLSADPALSRGSTIVTEIGGGSTEVLMLDGGDVVGAQSYRLGSLRLRETLEAFQAPRVSMRNIMESQIERTIEQVARQVARDHGVEVIALGGDIRFAASQIQPGWQTRGLARLPVDDLETLTDEVLAKSYEDLVRTWHLSFPDAETLGPALLASVQFARAFDLDHLYVSHFNLRDGLLKEMAQGGRWSDELKAQIMRSAIELGRKFHFDEAHGRHVARLCQKLFNELRDEHQLDSRYELILYISALLHEIGQFINHAGHHKHSMYIIEHSELFGLGKRDLLLVALVSRYHRKYTPKPSHQGYVTLDREQRIAVSKMAAMLRVADSLDRSYSQRIDDFTCHIERGRLVLSIPGVNDLSLEQLALRQKGPLFEEIFGLSVLLRKGRISD